MDTTKFAVENREFGKALINLQRFMWKSVSLDLKVYRFLETTGIFLLHLAFRVHAFREFGFHWYQPR